MSQIELLFNFCISIMNIPITLLGYSITMWQIFLYGGILYLVVRLFFGIMK